jgi:hypothetical protein
MMRASRHSHLVFQAPTPSATLPPTPFMYIGSGPTTGKRKPFGSTQTAAGASSSTGHSEAVTLREINSDSESDDDMLRSASLRVKKAAKNQH